MCTSCSWTLSAREACIVPTVRWWSCWDVLWAASCRVSWPICECLTWGAVRVLNVTLVLRILWLSYATGYYQDVSGLKTVDVTVGIAKSCQARGFRTSGPVCILCFYFCFSFLFFLFCWRGWVHGDGGDGGGIRQGDRVFFGFVSALTKNCFRFVSQILGDKYQLIYLVVHAGCPFSKR